jgi:ADP-dependent NAD(P)H-hydrate dehydratase / NAD(P)H-hydrate epimerase
MSESLQDLYDVEQIRELETQAIEAFHIPAHELMERAGVQAYDLLMEVFPETGSIAIVVGKGNNGGDGLVLARLAHEADIDVTAYMLVAPPEDDSAVGMAYQKAQDAGVRIQSFDMNDLPEADVIVDALLGIGIDGDVREPMASVIHWMNESGIDIFSLDLPSGLNADTGMPCGIAVTATATVTFIGLKQGLVTGHSGAYCGDIYLADLDLPEELIAEVGITAVRLDAEDLQDYLLPRERYAHKGDFGHVLVVGGDYGMAGAVRLAGEAGLRIGAGLVSVATRPEHIAAIVSARPELMVHGVEDVSDLEPLLERATAIVIGPGLGNSTWSQLLWARILKSDLPCVVDASALQLLSEAPCRRENWILTPHPGEAAKLLECAADEVQDNRYLAAQALQEKYAGVMVLKGAGTIIQVEDDIPDVCTFGNPGMASGGFGDVLAGVIGGLVAQGIPNNDAARLGVYLHAASADLAAADGERGLLASDLFGLLRAAANPYQANGEEEEECCAH